MQKQLYKPLWEYIPLTQYSRPSAPLHEMVRHSTRSFLSLLQPRPLHRRRLFSMPPYLLNRAAPVPDSAQVLTALMDGLRGWELSNESGQTVQMVVGAPGSGVAEVTTELARQKEWQLMGAPTIRQILAGGDAWLDQVNFFRQLAAHGRGLLGVIWQLWRQSLEIAIDGKIDLCHRAGEAVMKPVSVPVAVAV